MTHWLGERLAWDGLSGSLELCGAESVGVGRGFVLEYLREHGFGSTFNQDWDDVVPVAIL